jgi:hypothetical protein
MKATNKYIELVTHLNNSKTEEEHGERSDYLRAWCDGVADSGRFISMHMANLACAKDHPVKNGIWLDWEPHNGASEEYVRALNV